jgi:hypothetical protein
MVARSAAKSPEAGVCQIKKADKIKTPAKIRGLLVRVKTTKESKLKKTVTMTVLSSVLPNINNCFLIISIVSILTAFRQGNTTSPKGGKKFLSKFL